MTARCELCERPCPKGHRACFYCKRTHSPSYLAQLLAWSDVNPGHACHRCDCDLLKTKDRDAYLCGNCIVEEGDEQAEADRIEAEHIEQERRERIRTELAALVDFDRPLPRRMPHDLAELIGALS